MMRQKENTYNLQENQIEPNLANLHNPFLSFISTEDGGIRNSVQMQHTLAACK